MENNLNNNNNNNSKKITNTVLDNDGNVVEFDTDKEPKFPFLFRRFMEIFIASIISSVPFAIFYALGFSIDSGLALKIIGFSLLIFVILNFYLFRSFFYGMGNLKVYFKVNVAAYTIYAIINILVISLLLSFTSIDSFSLSSPYSFVYMPLQYANLLFGQLVSTIEGKYIVLSSIVMHLGMYLIIFLSPLEMYAFEKNKRSKRN